MFGAIEYIINWMKKASPNNVDKNFVKNIKYLIGIDEVGRGPLAGPVTLCAFLVPLDQPIKSSIKWTGKLARQFHGIKDSKQLSPAQRQDWYAKIGRLKKIGSKLGQIDYALASVSSTNIDRRGLSWAINSAVSRCLQKLCASSVLPETLLQPKHHQKLYQKRYQRLCPRRHPGECLVLLDGSLKAPPEFVHQKTIIKGDEKVPVIALASIVAKVTRDRYMTSMAKKYPGYGFEIHKGYGTRGHYEAIAARGLCPIHRRSFLNGH